MYVFIENSDQFFRAFGFTIEMMLLAGALALVFGFLLAGLRVSPIPLGRFVGTAYVNLVRNTPLLVLMLIFVFGFPELGIRPEVNLNELFGTNIRLLNFNTFLILATAALGFYTASFVCEAVRSGINSVAVGQAEAARSVGMTFGQTLQLVIMPQAFRAVIPPLASTLIAMTKNTSVAAAVGVSEATFLMRKFTNDYTSQTILIFLGFAAGYMVLVFAISGVAHLLERKTKVT